MTDAKLSLHRKLATIMYEADRIPKNGTAPQAMGGYKFVQVGDAADYIRKALAEKVITMMPVGVQVTGQADRPTAKGGTMTTVDLVTTWRLTDGESGEYIDIQSFGAGADGGDKYSGKASTSAMKYALLTGFLLSTGEDSELGGPEAGRREPPPATTPPPPKLPTNGDGSLIGTAELAKDFPDFLPKQTPDGMVLAFKLVSPQGGIKVIATGDLAEVLPTIRESVIGQRVSCWGRVRDETFRPKNARKDVTYQVLDLERIKTSLGTLPAVSVAPGASQKPVDEPPDDIELVGEAPTAPMFDDVPVAS